MKNQFIDYVAELSDFFGIPEDAVINHQSKYNFENEWKIAFGNNPEHDIDPIYRNSLEMLRQARYRSRRMVLYRRILQKIFGDCQANEFHSKKFAPYTKNKVLDFGCGIGDIGLMLAQIGFEVSLSEISDSEIKRFIHWRFDRRYLPFTWYDHDQQLPKQEFDYLIFVEVLEHVEKLDETLKNLYQSLKKDGLMFFVYEWPERALYPELSQSHEPVDEFLAGFEKIDNLIYRKK